MENDTLELSPDGSGKFAYKQMTLQEESYCELVAEGKSKRAAYRIAFDKPNATDNAIDQWAHRIKESRPDIQSRINEYKAEVMERRMEVWLNRQWEALDRLWLIFSTMLSNPETSMIALKAYQAIATTLGWTPGSGGSVTNVTVNNGHAGNAAEGALPQADANAKIQKLLELTAPKEGENDATN